MKGIMEILKICHQIMESKFDGKQIWKSGSQNVPNLVLFPLIAYKSHW